MLNGNSHDQATDHSWFAAPREALHDLGSSVRGYGGYITERIKAHPFAAAGIAFALGYVVVRMARR